MNLKKCSILFLFVLFFLSCNKKKITPDAIYNYRDYISKNSSGRISTTDVFTINFSKTILEWNAGDKLPINLIKVFPKTKGELIVKNSNTIYFVPEENLKPDTEYSVSIKLKGIFKNVPEKQQSYTFQCKTIKPNFSVSTKNLQSYSKDWQFIDGVIKSADYLTLKKARQLITAKQRGKNINVVINESIEKSKYFEFRIDSIQRFAEDDKIQVSWNGKSIKSKVLGEEFIIIPGKDNFKVTKIETHRDNEKYIAINFSDPLKKNQNFKGLVSIENVAKPKFVVNGNVLKVYHDVQLSGVIKINVFKGIKNKNNYKLKNNFSEKLQFEELKPQVRLISSGNILPNSANLKFNFEAVNLRAVDLRVIKVYTNNVLQFLQDNNLNSNSEIKRVGRRVAKKTIHLIEEPVLNTKNWKAYSVDLSKLFKADKGSIYRIELSYKKEYALCECNDNNDIIINEEAEKIEEEKEELYWDNKLYSYKKYSYNWRERNNPCNDAYYNKSKTIVKNLIASNIGVIAKKGSKQNYFFAITNILTTAPIDGAKISLYNYQQQKIDELTTNTEGIVRYNSLKDIYFAVITKNRNTTYLKLNDGNSLSLSKFDVSGIKTQYGLKGFIYGERGVWRPGDTIHLNFILNDNDNKLPKEHPVKLEVRDPNGKLIHKKITKENIEKFYSFSFKTSTVNRTGMYKATISVGGAKFYKTLKVETIKPNRLKIGIDFDKEILTSSSAVQGKLKVNWLHGAPARNIKAEVNAKVVDVKTTFKGYENYVFNDPTRSYSTEEISLFEGKLNEEGIANINKKIVVGKNAPGMLRVNFLVKAFENGGDFSIDAFSKKYAPYTSFIGMQSPKKDDYGSYQTNRSHRFNVVRLNDKGTPISYKKIIVKVYKIEWRWWWNSGRDNLSSYNSDNYHRPYKTFTATVNNDGKAHFNINIPKQDRGRYLIRVIDPVSGHATGSTMYFYDNWWENIPTDNKEAAKMLVFNADKKAYKVGEVAKITFPSAHVGKALVSLENGNKVIDHQWVNTQKEKTIVKILITKEMAPNFFVNISLLQPHNKIHNDLPIRLYGIIPIKVENSNTKLQPIISMPDSVEPEKEFEIVVNESNNKAMTYTLAIVEEGLLDLTRFKTPNPYQSFYAKEALGVRTWDVYDDVIGAYSGNIDQVFAIGGDGNSIKAKNRKANRFKPVVKHLGPFKLQAGKHRKHRITLPNYIGAIRTMVIAGNFKDEAYGNVEKRTIVKKPLMVLASLPRKLSPGEKVILPVTVFSMDKGSKNVSVSLSLSDKIEIVGEKEKRLHFKKPGEKMLYFELNVRKATGIQNIKIVAKSGSEKAKYAVEINVENPNPITSKVIHKVIKEKESISIDFKTFGLEKTNRALLQVSSVPPIDFEGRLSYLIQYPHGCVEQTTSSVLPQLFMSDLFDLSTERKNKVANNIKKGIDRLSHFQKPNGGLSYWIGESKSSDWGTSYAGHFMLEAEKKGYVLPFSFKRNWIRYQKETARNWKPNTSYSNDLNQAYRLYTLALSGNADLGAMNRMREYTNISNEAKWRLAAAYGLIGQNQASKMLANTASVDFREENNYQNYGSLIRNKAMALETMVLLKDDRVFELAKSIAKNLSSTTWLSTQTTAYGLLAMSKMIISNGGKSINATYSFRGDNENLNTSKSMTTRDLNVVKGNNTTVIKNNANNSIYVTLITKGKLALGDELLVNRGFLTNVKYTLPNGTPIDESMIQQGQDFIATVSVKNTTSEVVNDIALSQIFPSGWEIINTRFTAYGNTTKGKARYTDIRDDRVNFYFNLERKGNIDGTKTFSVLLNASYLGTYYLPGVQVEAMYNNDYLVRTKGKWIQVVK